MDLMDNPADHRHHEPAASESSTTVPFTDRDPPLQQHRVMSGRPNNNVADELRNIVRGELRRIMQVRALATDMRCECD